MRKLLLPAIFSVPLLISGCAPSSQYDYGYRSPGMIVEDRTIQNTIKDQLIQHDARYRDANVRVHSYNGIVLITGQVPSHELRDNVMIVAPHTRHARKVFNELSVNANARAMDRARDTWVSTRVKSALVRQKMANEDFVEPSRIHVISDFNDVYLMGIVTQQEAEDITNTLSEVEGVARIIRVFDYLD